MMKGYLLAWDPVRQREAWRVPNPGVSNGGVLSTAGGLVVQGDMDGYLNVYDSKTGRRLYRFDAQSGIMAAPISYSVGGRQYLTIVVGNGGAFSLYAGDGSWDDKGPRPNRSRVLTFALGGDKALPPTERLPAAMPDPPAQFGSPQTIEAGRKLYYRTCVACHGDAARSSGIIPDLRLSGALADRDVFYSVVGEGVLAANGMVAFTDYDRQQIETIRAYIIDRAEFDRRRGEAARRR
jgi:mono/diheme cytochrome c family protein